MVNPKVGGGSFFVSYDKQFFYKAYIKKIKHYFFVTMEGRLHNKSIFYVKIEKWLHVYKIT